MPLCASRIPIVRIFEDFDKMSAKEQQCAIENGASATDMGDRVIVKLIATHIDDKDCVSSNEDDDNRPVPSRSLRQRKRSTSNIYTIRRVSSGSPVDDARGRSETTPKAGSGLRKHTLNRTSGKPNGGAGATSPSNCSPGYTQYQKSLLEVPLPRDYGDASSDDLSSEWDSDVPEPKQSPKVFTHFVLCIVFFFVCILLFSSAGIPTSSQFK